MYHKLEMLTAIISCLGIEVVSGAVSLAGGGHDMDCVCGAGLKSFDDAAVLLRVIVNRSHHQVTDIKSLHCKHTTHLNQTNQSLLLKYFKL